MVLMNDNVARHHAIVKPEQANHSPDPTLASGTSPAGQEPRHR
jgi:hypothetical protein